jgi:hypothetical protein
VGGDPDTLLDSSSLDLRVHPDPGLQAKGQPYIDMLAALGAYLFDADTYVLSMVRHDDGGFLRLTGAVGTYYDALRTCDALEWELFLALARWPEYDHDIAAFLAAELPLRYRAHSLSRGRDPVVETTGRSAALAISTLVLCKRGDEWVVLIGDRSERGVAMHGDLFHVIPSCMFQPVTTHVWEEFSLTHTFYREYLEELCGRDEVADGTSVLPDYFQRDPNYLYLKGLIDGGEATLTLSGVVVNPLNLRPEVCLLLCIATPEWFASHAVGRGELSHIEFGDASWASLQRSGPNVIPVTSIEGGGMEQETIVPPGAGAVVLGLRAARELGYID